MPTFTFQAVVSNLITGQELTGHGMPWPANLATHGINPTNTTNRYSKYNDNDDLISMLTSNTAS